MDRGVSVQADWDIHDWNAKLTSISAFREWDTKNGADLDFTDADILYRTPDQNTEGFQTWTQELRLSGSTNRLDWLVGGYFENERLSDDVDYAFGSQYTPFISEILSQGESPNLVNALTGSGAGCAVYGLGCGPSYITGPGVQDHYSQDKQSFSLFSNDTIKLTDKLDVTLGLRWTTDRKTLATNYQNENGNGATCGAALNSSGQRKLGGPRQWADPDGVHRRRALPALDQPVLRRPDHPPEARREQPFRHGQAVLQLDAECPDLRLLRARLQGRRLQPRPHDHRQRPAQWRHRLHARHQHQLPGRNGRQLRGRAKTTWLARQAAAEPHALRRGLSSTSS